MDDGGGATEEPVVKLFGDPRSPGEHVMVERRSSDRPSISPLDTDHPLPPLPILRRLDSGHAVRIGRGDAIATWLAVLGLLTFGVSVIAGAIILYNAKTVGAFGDPWDSGRVAIGLAVVAMGVVQSALLVGVSRAITYLLADLRLRAHDLDLQRHA